MSQENVEILRQANAAFNRGDIEGFLEFVVDDIEVEELKNAPDLPPVVKGKDAVRGLLVAWTETFGDFRGEIVEYIDVDEHHVACVVHYRGKERRTGMDIEFKTVDIWEIRGRKLVQGKTSFPDRESAIQGMGLPEQDAQRETPAG
jgi:ketosteroid isomerase-like protein